MSQPLYAVIAAKVSAIESCMKNNNVQHKTQHENDINALVKEYMPSGGGFNYPVDVVWEDTKSERLVFETKFDHMNEYGFYVGTTPHKITVTPSLAFDVNIKVSGQNQKGAKEQITDAFLEALKQPVPNEYPTADPPDPPKEEGDWSDVAERQRDQLPPAPATEHTPTESGPPASE